MEAEAEVQLRSVVAFELLGTDRLLVTELIGLGALALKKLALLFPHHRIQLWVRRWADQQHRARQLYLKLGFKRLERRGGEWLMEAHAVEVALKAAHLLEGAEVDVEWRVCSLTAEVAAGPAAGVLAAELAALQAMRDVHEEKGGDGERDWKALLPSEKTKAVGKGEVWLGMASRAGTAQPAAVMTGAGSGMAAKGRTAVGGGGGRG